MRGIKHFTFCFSLVTTILLSMNSISKAKSVYAIIDHGYASGPPAKIASYGINADQIDLQKTLTLDQSEYPVGQFLGPVGLALHPDSQIIFVTYEDSEIIEMLNAKKMIYEENPVKLARTAHLDGLFANQDHKDLSGIWDGLMV